jgi:hypothetical protein
MKTPFKFLDAYKLEDRDQFFGRDREIAALYEMVFKTPLLLVYGLSGTGKTSLVQCGLANEFDGPDWFPFFIRRQENINESLRASLRKALRAFGATPPDDLLDMVRALYRQSYRPIYLIFDQFEELFILGSEAEQQDFIADVQRLLDSGLSCKVLLILREEYLGYLYPFEKEIPSLFDFHLRVEPMNASKAKEVVASSFDKFNISLAAPEAENLQLIIDNIGSEKWGIHLPFLQVYLDRLYFEKYQQQGVSARQEARPALQFTRKDITRFGKIENVLKKFLEDRKVELEQELNKQFGTRYTHVTGDILDAFVTEEGTKRPVFFSRTEDGKEIRVAEAWRKFFPSVPDAYLSASFELLKQSRILRISEDTIELGHDSLAPLIAELLTDEQRQRKEIKRRILMNYEEFQDTKQYLSAEQLALYEAFLPRLELAEEVKSFIAASKTKQKQEQARQRRYTILATLVAAVAIMFVIFYIRQNQNLKDANLAIQLATAESLKNEGQFDAAIARLDSINLDALGAEKKEEVTDKRKLYTELAAIISRADDIVEQKAPDGNYLLLDSLVTARQLYDAAYAKAPSSFIQKKANDLAEYIEAEGAARIREARDILNRLEPTDPIRCRLACQYIKIAKLLEQQIPEDLPISECQC